MLQMPVEPVDDGDATQARAEPDVPIDRLAEAIRERVARTLWLRGIRGDERLAPATRELAKSLAEAAASDVAGGIDADDIDGTADTCAAIVCDLPTANIMEILLPDPHLEPLGEALREIASLADGKEGLGVWRPLPLTGEEMGSGTHEEAERRRAALDAADRAMRHWDALSPHGRALAKVDRDAVRRGLISSLGFEGFLDAERRLGGVLAPRQPYRVADE